MPENSMFALGRSLREVTPHADSGRVAAGKTAVKEKPPCREEYCRSCPLWPSHTGEVFRIISEAEAYHEPDKDEENLRHS